MPDGNTITRERIAAMEPRIRPFVRHTPTLRVDMADFGRPAHAVDLRSKMRFWPLQPFQNQQPPVAGKCAKSRLDAIVQRSHIAN